MDILHIHNGDATANTARLTALPGEHFAFREALIEGPTPAGLGNDEWQAMRAQHLSESYGVELELCERELVEQENKLATFAQHEEIVLWFEYDLFCQVNLLYLLRWFSLRPLHSAKLSLVCIDQFPGVKDFRGLGQLSSEQLSSLFPGRTEIKPAHLQLASSAWQAYCSPNPTAIEYLLATDTSALPFLDAALRAHLKRFPSVKNGLGAIENTALHLIQSGKDRFIDLFQASGDASPIYGLGDAQFWLALTRMNGASKPLVTITGVDGDQIALTPEIVGHARCEITEFGESVLRGDADSVSLNGIELWLGGVHLEGQTTPWRWDEKLERISPAAQVSG